uniref:Minor capsid component n=1 Tax=virus sp. ct5rm7 TaxID=2827298 RepID=A0A8S5RFN8_9VIRU|nr:MAG TPA: minor capsid component [virus sp. ct5rm7]
MTARLPLPDILAARADKTDTQKEYETIREAFRRLIFNWENDAGRKDIIGDIITLRCSFLIDRALRGLRIDFGQALDILRNHNDFTTERERQQRDILVAAIDNLVDFAAAEESALLEELPDEPQAGDIAGYESLCERYNLTYASKENDQVLFAASVAAWWLTIDAGTLVTFMTQGDERVRAWHLSLEGISYRKSEFPPELIPPVEWGCRCFLVADGVASVHGALPVHDGYRRHIDPVFRESLATGGRIFSPAHAYFSKPLPEYVQQIVKRIKERFDYAENNAR